MSVKPSELELTRDTVRAAISRVRVGMPGVVESYDATTESATVRPLIRGRLRAAGSTYEMPAIPRVPVLFPRGAGFVMRWPLAAGDHVWLTWADRSLEGYLVRGEEVDPSGTRRFHLGDAVAIPGITPNTSRSVANPTDLVLGREDGSMMIRVTPEGKVAIEGTGGELLSILDNVLEALQSATVATSLGPQPLDPATLTTIGAARTALGSIKV